jgi:hypothetical protein
MLKPQLPIVTNWCAGGATARNFTIAYNCLEGLVSIVAGPVAGSVSRIFIAALVVQTPPHVQINRSSRTEMCYNYHGISHQ